MESEAAGVAVLVVILILSIYFLPTHIAVSRRHNAAAIFVLNLLLGWTGLFWIIALVWSLTDKARR
jgi:hypothetical protein